MDFKQLRSYTYVVQYKSFTLAAEKLALSQPTISTHIRQLEDELGLPLIVRTTKNIDITEKGREIYEYAVQLLQIRDRLEAACEPETKNHLHIGASTIPSCYVLPNLLAEYRKLYPAIDFNIRQTDSQGVVDGLNQNIFDIGFLGKEPSANDFYYFPLCEDRLVLITPDTDYYRDLQKEGKYPDFRTETFLSREQGSGSQDLSDQVLKSFGINQSDLHISAKVNDSETIKNMVANQLGIAIISEKAAENFVDSGKILQFELAKNTASRYLYVAYRKYSFLSQETQNFLTFLKEHAIG
ncbi:MAG: LysR family transcriptional regulator [Lachnospiraceae bacterium]|nr:LysR family transcriptional regulator [Lachnospiraceae bacterium]